MRTSRRRSNSVLPGIVCPPAGVPPEPATPDSVDDQRGAARILTLRESRRKGLERGCVRAPAIQWVCVPGPCEWLDVLLALSDELEEPDELVDSVEPDEPDEEPPESDEPDDPDDAPASDPLLDVSLGFHVEPPFFSPLLSVL